MTTLEIARASALNTSTHGEALAALLAGMEEIAIAVSGGVDSMTLATFAHRLLGRERVSMFHATSPAVPEEATLRTRTRAQQEGWRLSVIGAGEFDDPDYRANPVNRCYFCKTNLYAAIAKHTGKQMLSGANTDDLGEYRPGLIAAREYRVRHPFVEARMSKDAVRALARALGLEELAELPSSPCLASRLETGVRVEAHLLRFVAQAEEALRAYLRDQLAERAPKNVRCRVRGNATVVELDAGCFSLLGGPQQEELRALVSRLAHDHRIDQPVQLAPYRVGSAFLHERRSHQA